ncbi:DDE-type integrase/transposase/recombinase [Undibacterium sp. TJN19]|uniref:DDE-type integrase/transposase/recombinase n=1 Tax=Undibacterium sp. TJN19 TaxID=3413055 RepID=UPI003BEFA89F
MPHKSSPPEQVWVADISYTSTKEKFIYLNLITDADSRKIAGHCVRVCRQNEEVNRAFKAVLKIRKIPLPLIHHPDGEIQYCSAYYQQTHKHNITYAMTDECNC